MYTRTTHNVKITVLPVYLADQSRPEDNFYVWAYSVTMENFGKDRVKLLTRHWHITDAMGRVNEVRGPGVVGEHPSLGFGESYRYTSGTHLPTSSGIMRGTYQFILDNGTPLDIETPVFSLDSPAALQRPN